MRDSTQIRIIIGKGNASPPSNENSKPHSPTGAARVLIENYRKAQFRENYFYSLAPAAGEKLFLGRRVLSRLCGV